VNFQYSVVRVVPSAIADESINVGVIVSDGHHTIFQTKMLDRIPAAFPGIDPQAIEVSLAHLDELGQAEAKLDLGELCRRTSGALVQVSKPATTIGTSIDNELHQLLELYVGGYRAASAATFQSVGRASRRAGATRAGG
jgi:hypothetical protein